MAHNAFAHFLAKLESLPARSRLSDADTEAIYSLAYQLVSQGHIENAYRYFSFLTLYRPTTVKYLAGLALSNKLLKRYDAAVGVYAFMGQIEPAQPQHLLNLAECQLLQGNTHQARENLAQIQRFCADNAGHDNTRKRAETIALLLCANEPA